MRTVSLEKQIAGIINDGQVLRSEEYRMCDKNHKGWQLQVYGSNGIYERAAGQRTPNVT